MKVKRGDFLSKLNAASVATSQRESTEQSNSFCFTPGLVRAFNNYVYAKVPSPLDFTAVVNAKDMLEYLSKVPDEELEITLGDDEIVIKGKRRSAGITCVMEDRLPVGSIPDPTEWHDLPDGVMEALSSAAKTCGKDQTEYITTVVHVSPDWAEGSDSYRLLRATLKTGFPKDVLIPADNIKALEGINAKKVSIGQGWVYFQDAGGGVVALSCSHEPYLNGVESMFEMPDTKEVTLPTNLKEIVERAGIFTEKTYDAKVLVKLMPGRLSLSSDHDRGWAKERRAIKYDGPALEFMVNPDFLIETLAKTRTVTVNAERLKLEVGNTKFVVQLFQEDEKDKEEDETPVDPEDEE